MESATPFPRNKKDIQKPILTAKTLVLLTAVFLSFKLLLIWSFPQARTQASDLTVANILSGVNRERQLRNLLTLNDNQMLAVAAQSKADDMMNRHYFSHVDPEGNYIWPKIVAAGYTPYSQLGENLAIEFLNTESLISAWMNSPTHRANILQEGFKDQGAGLSFGDIAKNQYRSAVANTFGTLIASNKQPVLSETITETPPPTTTPAPAPTPTPTKPKTATPEKPAETVTQTPATPKTETPTPAPAPAPVQPPRQPIALRGSQELPSFATPQHTTSSTAPSSTPDGAAQAAVPVSALSKVNVDAYKLGRYLTLGVGILLLILLLADIKTAIADKFRKLDKKTNNLVLLVLALIVVALMYWL